MNNFKDIKVAVAGTGYCYFNILKIIHHDIVFFSFFLKSSRPSLPLKKALFENLPVLPYR